MDQIYGCPHKPYFLACPPIPLSGVRFLSSSGNHGKGDATNGIGIRAMAADIRRHVDMAADSLRNKSRLADEAQALLQEAAVRVEEAESEKSNLTVELIIMTKNVDTLTSKVESLESRLQASEQENAILRSENRHLVASSEDINEILKRMEQDLKAMKDEDVAVPDKKRHRAMKKQDAVRQDNATTC